MGDSPALGLTRNSERTLHYLYFDADEHPIAAQISARSGCNGFCRSTY
jgi:hypothetical protein